MYYMFGLRFNNEASMVEPYDRSQGHFRFTCAEGVEPTNNHSEQPIRHCVIDRRITQGTRGAAGRRYHERMWTTIATCKKQGSTAESVGEQVGGRG